MKKIFLIIPFLLITCILLGQEEQIPFDKEGKITILDAKLNNKIGYFNNYSGFREALLFAVNDSTYLLEVTYQPGTKTLRERKQISGKDLEQLRLKIQESISQKAPEYVIEQDGRTTLLIASTIGSLYEGSAVITALDLSGRSAVAAYMFTVGAGFAVPFYLTKKEPVSVASAYLAVYGESRGIIHGFALASILSANNRISYGTSLITSISEGYIGYRYARVKQLAAGESFAMQMYGDLFSGVGLLTCGSLGLFDHGNVSQRVSTTYLISNMAGLMAGKYISSISHYETGDGFYLFNTSALSALTGITLVDYVNPADNNYYKGFAALSAIGGMYLGHSISKNNDYSFGEGILTTLGTIAGSLTGLGTSIILTDNFNFKSLLTASTLGGWAGFFTMKTLFDKNHLKDSKKTSYQFSIGALPVFAMGKKNAFELTPKAFIPSLNFNMKF